MDPPENSKEDDLYHQLEVIKKELAQKDEKILGLTECVLKKDRQIFDFQEICRGHDQVAHSKSLALNIVNSRLRELENRRYRDASTETDANAGQTEKDFTRRARKLSPGRAMLHLKLPGASPPPDPTDDNSSNSTEIYSNLEHVDPLSSESLGKQQSNKKSLKRVTFNLNKSVTPSAIGPSALQINDEPNISNEFMELVAENDQLRSTISDIEKNSTFSNNLDQINKLERQILELKQDSRTKILKTRAFAQARIKELESLVCNGKDSYEKEIENLKAVNESLKTSREWTLEENGRLLSQLSNLKQKCEDLHSELDASLDINSTYRVRLDESNKNIDKLKGDANQSLFQLQQMSEEKHSLQSETERLKEAIYAQEELIGVLEGDIIVYEERVGILRDSLGASKDEERQHFRSKAYAAKIKALETENQEIIKLSKDEKLRTKALTVKILCLEEERDKLLHTLRQYEKEYGSNKSHIEDISTLQEHLRIANEQIQSTTLENSAMVSKLMELNARLNTDQQSISEFVRLVCSRSTDTGIGTTFTPSADDEAVRVDTSLAHATVLINQLFDKYSILLSLHEELKDQLEQEKSSHFDSKQIELGKRAELEANQERLKNHLHENEIEMASIKKEYLDNVAKIQEMKQSMDRANNEHSEQKARLEYRLQEIDKQLLDCLVDKERLEQRLIVYEKESSIVSTILDKEREKSNRLINLLQDEVERFKAESKLSNVGFPQNSENEIWPNSLDNFIDLFNNSTQESSILRLQNFCPSIKVDVAIQCENKLNQEMQQIDGDDFDSDGLIFQKSSDLLSSDGHDIEIVNRRRHSMCENVNSARKYVEELRQWHEDSSQSKIKGDDPTLCDIGVNTIEDIFSDFNIELESSINLLKSEIWSLNQELEKRNLDNQTSSNRIKKLEELNQEIELENNSLKSELQSKDIESSNIKQKLTEEVIQLQHKYQQLTEEFKELSSRMVETNEKLHVSDEHVIRLRVLIGQIVGVCRESLKAIMLEQVQCSEELLKNLNEMNLHCEILLDKIRQSFKRLKKDENESNEAARLVTKSADSNALLRENEKLVAENVSLYQEIEQLKNEEYNQLKSEENEGDESEIHTLQPLKLSHSVIAICNSKKSEETADALIHAPRNESVEATIAPTDMAQLSSEVPLSEFIDNTAHFTDVNSVAADKEHDKIYSCPSVPLESKNDNPVDDENSEEQCTVENVVDKSANEATAMDSNEDWKWEDEDGIDAIERVKSPERDETTRNQADDWTWNEEPTERSSARKSSSEESENDWNW